MMMKSGLRMGAIKFVALTAVAALAACSVTTSDDGSPNGSPSSSSSGATSSGGGSSGASSSGASSSGASSGSSSGASSGATPTVSSTTEANIELNAACPAFVACGGAPQGTYDYTGGCVGDVFAAARQQCPGLTTTNVKSTVKGSIFFLASSGLQRDVTSNVSGTILLPAECSQGQCTTVESALAGSFDSATCKAQGGGCSCVVSKTATTKDTTTYSISGNNLTTADGDVYSICEKTGQLAYHGNGAGSEEGNFTLAKR